MIFIDDSQHGWSPKQENLDFRSKIESKKLYSLKYKPDDIITNESYSPGLKGLNYNGIVRNSQTSNYGPGRRFRADNPESFYVKFLQK